MNQRLLFLLLFLQCSADNLLLANTATAPFQVPVSNQLTASERVVWMEIDSTDAPAFTSAATVCRVRTESLQAIQNVMIELSAPSVPLQDMGLTDANGIVEFSPLDDGTVFGITCTKNNAAGNGLSTMDIIQISRHILGLEPLSSPYKMIAADANKSGSITTFDIVTIRSVILGLITEFPNNTSWRFIPSDYVFPNPINPFPSNLPVTGVFTAPVLQPIDFIGIKIGDVNNSADPFNLTVVDERDLHTLFFETENKKVAAGETFIATFSSSEQAEGFQFTLHTGDLEILEVLPGTGMNAEQFAVFPLQNTLTTACETAGKARFALRLKSHRAGELRDMLRISSDITHAEAYLEASGNKQPAMAHVDLRFKETVAAFQLYQNQPNPAAAQTNIAFFLPSDAAATLNIYDNAGRTVYSKSGTYEKGAHALDIDLTGIAPGVLYYQLQTEGHCAIRKMLRL